MWYQRRANKYGAKKQVYNNLKYDSKGEAGYARDLDLLLKAKEIKSYERQVRFSLDVNGYHIANYIADFVVIDKYDEKQIHEYKGMILPVFQLKWKLMEALYGKEYKLILIKQ